MRYIKGGVGEWVVWLYIRDVLAKKLKEEEKWDEVLYIPVSLIRSRRHFLTLPNYEYEAPLWLFDDLLDLFIYEGFLPSPSLLDSLSSKGVEGAACIGDRVPLFLPDGIILKLSLGGKENRERIEKEYKNCYSSGFLTKRIKDLKERLAEQSYFPEHLDEDREFDEIPVERTLVSHGALPKEILPLRMLRPAIKGEVELVEVKTGKSQLTEHERENFLRYLAEGIPVRIFRVEIEDFDRGIFRITQFSPFQKFPKSLYLLFSLYQDSTLLRWTSKILEDFLKEEQIKQLYKEGKTYREIAQITRTSIKKISEILHDSVE
jgi:hypothetical protein